MKKILIVFVLLLMVLLTACGGGASTGVNVPDIFGISYTDAMDILKADGFEVTAIETDVSSISEKLLYPLEKVSKGTVFKIDNYILDNLGNLTKDYDVFYDGELISEDKSVVIYYAKEDYILEKESVENNDSTTTDVENINENDNTPKEEPDVMEETDKENDNSDLAPDFKAAMDSYETFMNEYVSFMKKYKENPTDFSLLSDYTDFMSDYTDFAEDFEGWEDEDLNSAEYAYYIDVQTRVNKKLLEVAS